MLIYGLYLEIKLMWHLPKKKTFSDNQQFDKEKMSKEFKFYFEWNV